MCGAKRASGVYLTDDTMATSRAIDALPSPQLEAFAEALVDRVTAIVLGHQTAISAAHTAFDTSLGEIRYQLTEVNRHAQADRNDRALLADFLERLDARFDKWREDVNATLADFRRSRDLSVQEREELRADMELSKADRAAIRSDLVAYRESIQQEMLVAADAVTARIVTHDALVSAQLADLAAHLERLERGINGRLTALLDSREREGHAAGHKEGRAEERMHPGSG